MVSREAQSTEGEERVEIEVSSRVKEEERQSELPTSAFHSVGPGEKIESLLTVLLRLWRSDPRRKVGSLGGGRWLKGGLLLLLERRGIDGR